MNKEARLFCLVLATALIAALAGCARKPAYSEMDTNKNSKDQNQAAESQSSSSTPAATEPGPAPEAAKPAPAPAPFKSPTFLDPARGEIRDLPSYPNSSRISASIGPVQGVNTMSLAYNTPDPMNKITTFFDRVIKDNKWTVVDKVIDQDLSEWSLKKGEQNSAKVSVNRNPQTGALVIVMVRGELEATTK